MTLKRILIVDDSETARMFIRRGLEIAGCAGASFVEAKTGQDALNVLNAEAADLIVTDLNMPGMNGADFLKNIKSTAQFAGIPVFVITSANNPAREKMLKTEGAHCVLSKPVTPAVLAAALKTLMPAPAGK